MRRTAAALVLCLAAVLAPAASAAPPPNDNYLQSDRLNQPGSELSRGPVTVQIDNREATEQGDLLAPGPGGGPPEPLNCDGVPYGKTVWYDLYPHKDGYVQVTVGGFDSAIGIVPFRSVDDSYPLLADFACINRLTGINETGVQYVRKGRGYSAQIGGTNGAAGTAELQFEFFPDSDSDRVADEGDKCKDWPGVDKRAGCPAKLAVTDTFRGESQGSGYRFRALAVDAPKGAQIAVRCRPACGSQTVAAKRRSLSKFVGKLIKSGQRLEIRVTKANSYGVAIDYAIRSGKVARTLGCSIPGSVKLLRESKCR